MALNILAKMFAGEMGWEICRWQGHLRYLSKTDKVIVECGKGHGYLYEDFASELIERPYHVEKKDKWSGVYCPAGLSTYGISKTVYPCKKLCENKKLKQEFIRYGEKGHEIGYDILMHARSTQHPERNWPMEKWLELCEVYQDKRVGFIGSPTGADYPWGIFSKYGRRELLPADDLRGIPLKRLANIMAESKVLVSPSSGPAHFASLCGLPHIVFSDKKKWNLGCKKGTNWTRYKRAWNYLGTKCTVLDEYNWQPPVERVVESIERFL